MFILEGITGSRFSIINVATQSCLNMKYGELFFDSIPSIL